MADANAMRQQGSLPRTLAGALSWYEVVVLVSNHAREFPSGEGEQGGSCPLANRKSKYPPEIEPLMYCLGCATLDMRASLREERRAAPRGGGRESSVWVCPAGHVLVRLIPQVSEGETA